MKQQTNGYQNINNVIKNRRYSNLALAYAYHEKIMLEF